MKKQGKFSKAVVQWSYDNKKVNKKLLRIQKSFDKLADFFNKRSD